MTAEAAAAPVERPATTTTTSRASARGVVRLWRAVAGAQASLDHRLDASEGSCQVLGSDTVAVLLPLAEAPDGALQMHQLAESSHLTPSGLTRRIDRLAERGWVTRRACASDRRVSYAALTDAGRRELEAALPFHADSLERHLESRLTPGELDLLVGLLQRVSR